MLALTGAAALEPAAIPAFSAARPGEPLPRGWREALLPNKKAPEFALVADEGTTVLRVRSSAAAGTAAHSFHIDATAHPTLAWRWKIDRVVERGDLAVKSGDDFAARVYVFFDLPEEEMPWNARMRLKLARLLHGGDLPSAGICYVWDNRHAVGASAWNPYWYRVRTVVLESGNARAGHWAEERRDLVADFVAAFGSRGGNPVPAVTGIAIGNDTDQTLESVTAWFGDFRIEARR